jgi:nucleoside 2-deoxyribosyltransferase
MSYLKNKQVYLAGPIHAVVDDGMGWREEVTPILIEKFGLVVDDPCKKTVNGVGEVKEDKKKLIDLIKNRQFKEAKQLFWPIVRKDLRAVDRSDFLIVVYDPTVHMFGTIHEMIEASHQKKPILMWFDEKKIESFNPWALALVKENCIFTKWADLFDYLKVIDSGKIDSSYWTL